MKKIMSLILLILVISLPVYATEYPGLPFLQLYPGAREVCMGGTFCAIADDAMATFYNPAGLAFQKSIDLSIDHCNWLPGLYEGMYYEFLALSLPVTNNFVIAPSINYLSPGKTEVTDPEGNYLGEYTSYDISTGISIGKKVNPYLGIGGTIKYLHSHLVAGWVFEAMPELGIERGGTGSSFAFDIGLLVTYQWLSGKSNIGFVIQNIGPNIKYTSSENEDRLPLSVRLGVSHNIDGHILFPKINIDNDLLKWFLDQSHICFGFDIYKPLIGSQNPRLTAGIELAPLAVILIRGGYLFIPHNNRTFSLLKNGITWGVGINCKFLKIDYGSDSSIYNFHTNNHRWSITINIRT